VLNSKTDDSGKGGESVVVFVYQQYRPYLSTLRDENFLLIHHLKSEPLPVIIHKAQQVLYRYFLENSKILKGIVLYLGNYGSCYEVNIGDHVQVCLLFCLLLHDPLALINQAQMLVLTSHCY